MILSQAAPASFQMTSPKPTPRMPAGQIPAGQTPPVMPRVLSGLALVGIGAVWLIAMAPLAVYAAVSPRKAGR